MSELKWADLGPDPLTSGDRAGGRWLASATRSTLLEPVPLVWRPDGEEDSVRAYGFVALGLAAILVGCGDSADSEGVATTSADVASSTTAQETTTSTPSSTTTTTTTTSTTLPPLPSMEFGETWPYSATVEYLGPDPSASPDGCADTARPGETYALVEISVTNLTDDREAPFPALGIYTNLGVDGSIVPEVVDFASYDSLNDIDGPVVGTLGGGYGSNPVFWTIATRWSGGGRCVLSLSNRSLSGPDIPAGGTSTEVVQIGEIPDPPPPGMFIAVVADRDPEISLTVLVE